MVEPPRRSRLAWELALVGIAALLLVALVAGWSASRPSTATIDGQDVVLASGTTIEDLVSTGAVAAKAGDLVSVDGKILLAGGGHAARVVRNGRLASTTQRVYAGDAVVSYPGMDSRESIIVTDVVMPFDIDVEGEGSMSEVKSEGKTGVRRVTMGLVSGVEITSTVVSQPVNSVILRVHPTSGTRMVALTFDDGPWPGQTDRILDILREKQVHATFFMLGARAKRAPVLAKRVASEGHLVGNHTYGHKSLADSKPAEARRQIDRGRVALNRYTGVNTTWLRPPYGDMDKGAWKVVKASGSRVVMWTVDSHDWEKPPVKKMVRNVVRHAKPGSIILMHDGGGDREKTIAALPEVIDKLKAKGYNFVTVDEMYEARSAQ